MIDEARKLRDYEGRLREAGVRITRPRRAILQILSETADHPDAMEIFKRALALDSTTVSYTHLDVYKRQGKVR